MKITAKHLIDKDALVAEIKSLENIYKEFPAHNSYEDGLKDGRLIGYKDALYKIDTLEVKGVDSDYIKKELDELIRIHKPDGDFGWGTLYNVATHFFELGLKQHE